MALVLGFENYADVSLESKMAPDVAAVDALLEEGVGGARLAPRVVARAVRGDPGQHQLERTGGTGHGLQQVGAHDHGHAALRRR